MATPAAATPSLQDRVLNLAKTLQFAWFVGHVSMLFFTARYVLYYITMKTASRWAGFSYRVAFLSAIVTYGIVVYKSYRARVRQGKATTPVAMLSEENVQYLLMAAVWSYSKQYPLALLPFVVYSIFHVATYVRGSILPAIYPPTASPNAAGPKSKPTGKVADAIGNFIKEYYDASMSAVAFLELFLWFRLLGSAILFAKGSWVLLVVYTAFLRTRFAQSKFVQGMVANLSARGDATFGKKDTNPQLRSAWDTLKASLKTVHDTTDLNKYLGRGQVGEGAKKAQ